METDSNGATNENGRKGVAVVVAEVVVVVVAVVAVVADVEVVFFFFLLRGSCPERVGAGEPPLEVCHGLPGGERHDGRPGRRRAARDAAPDPVAHFSHRHSAPAGIPPGLESARLSSLSFLSSFVFCFLLSLWLSRRFSGFRRDPFSPKKTPRPSVVPGSTGSIRVFLRCYHVLLTLAGFYRVLTSCT